MAFGLVTEILGATTPHPITFRVSEGAYIVQIDDLSVRKVSQDILGGQQEGEHGIVHQVQGEHYQLKVLRV